MCYLSSGQIKKKNETQKSQSVGKGLLKGNTVTYLSIITPLLFLLFEKKNIGMKVNEDEQL